MYYKTRCKAGYAFEDAVKAVIAAKAALQWDKQHAGADYTVDGRAYVEIKTTAKPVMTMNNLSYDQRMQMLDKPNTSWVIATSKGLEGCRLIWFPRLAKGELIILPRLTAITIERAIRHIEYVIGEEGYHDHERAYGT